MKKNALGTDKKLRITSLKVDNFKRIQTAEITPDGDIIEIHGKNGSGKSSALDAIWSVLRGKAVPGMPINKNAKQAKIEIISQLENRVSELQSESAKLQDLNTDLQARLNKIVNPAFTKTEDSISSWKEAMAKCNNDYVKARKTYPQLWEKYTFKK